MMTRLIAICTLFLLAAAPAHAKNINASGAVRADLLNRALEAQKIHAKETKDTGRLVIVDYSRHSKEERLFVVNLESGDVTGFRAAHGRGSDTDHDGFLDRFSDAGLPVPLWQTRSLQWLYRVLESRLETLPRGSSQGHAHVREPLIRLQGPPANVAAAKAFWPVDTVHTCIGTRDSLFEG